MPAACGQKQGRPACSADGKICLERCIGAARAYFGLKEGADTPLRPGTVSGMIRPEKGAGGQLQMDLTIRERGRLRPHGLYVVLLREWRIGSGWYVPQPGRWAGWMGADRAARGGGPGGGMRWRIFWIIWIGGGI